MKSNKRGRPTLHGIKIITSERIRKSRLAMANGSSKSRLAEDIFKVSPRTFRRLLSINHPMAIALKQAIIDGEQLQGEPLAHLLCMLRDQSPDQIMPLLIIAPLKRKALGSNGASHAPSEPSDAGAQTHSNDLPDFALSYCFYYIFSKNR